MENKFIANDKTEWLTQASATQRNILLWALKDVNTKEQLLEVSNHCAGMDEKALSKPLLDKLIEMKSPVLTNWINLGFKTE